MDFNNKYSRVNNSFRRKCIFRIGVSEGFFSELNNMIFALLYNIIDKQSNYKGNVKDGKIERQ